MKTYFIWVVLVLCYIPVWSQNYEEWLKEKEKTFEEKLKNAENDIQKQKTAYEDFTKKIDTEFAAFLKKNWLEYQIFSGKLPEDALKPVEIPKYNGKDRVKQHILPTVSNNLPETEKWPFIQLKRNIQKNDSLSEVHYDFYGTPCSFRIAPGLTELWDNDVTKENIAVFWDAMSESPYPSLLESLAVKQRELGLNDWGYYMLINQLTMALSDDENFRQLLQWFLLSKSGYITRLAYSQDKITLLLPSRQEIYYMPYITQNGIIYYITRDIDKHLFTYDGSKFDTGHRIMDLGFSQALNFREDSGGQRKVSWRDTTLNFCFNSHVIDFFKDYPSTQLRVYFNTPVSAIAKESFFKELTPLLKDQSPAKQVELLLDFVQQAFPYQTDDKQFGKEKYFFSEEILAYPYSDCDDRAAFFAYLVRSLTGLETIEINYPGHVTAAVQIPDNELGDYVIYQKYRYVICDPTYIGAPVGVSMPDFAQLSGEIIAPAILSRSREEAIVRSIEQAGGYVLDPFNNIVFDNDQAFVCGIFDHQFCYGDTILKTNGNGYHTFLAKVTPEGRIGWATSTHNSNLCLPQQLILHDSLLYLSGQFEGNMRLGDFQLVTQGQPDHFVTQVTPEGDVRWLTATGILKNDSLPENAYIAKINQEGKLLDASLLPDEGGVLYPHLAVNNQQEILLTGLFTPYNGMVKSSVKGSSLSLAEQLYNLTAKQVQNSTDRAIAGLLAVIGLINESNIAVSGKIATETLDKYNPGFKNKNPNIYKNIENIDFIRNSDGIIQMKTRNGKAVNFDKVQVKDGSKIKIVNQPDKNVRVEIISGIQVGKAFIWFKLNHITLCQHNGDMIFDYDTDHTLRTFNMGRDILN